MAMIIVNEELKVTRFTPSVGAFFHISASDCGQVITTIPSTITLPDMRRMLTRVIQTKADHEQEISVNGDHYRLRVRPYLDESGRSAGAMLTFIDMSAAKRSDMALAKSNAYLRAVLDNVFDGIVVADERGVIEAFNPSAERIFGYSRTEAVGQNVSTLQPEPDRSRHDNYIKNYTETGKASIIGIGREVKGLRKSGRTFPMELAVTEMWIDGERKFVGIVRDLSTSEG